MFPWLSPKASMRKARSWQDFFFPDQVLFLLSGQICFFLSGHYFCRPAGSLFSCAGRSTVAQVERFQGPAGSVFSCRSSILAFYRLEIPLKPQNRQGHGIGSAKKAALIGA